MAFSVALQLGASVALARPAAPPEARAEADTSAAITPSAQALSYAIRELRHRVSAADDPRVEEVWAEAEIDYSHMDRITLAATHAPDIELSEQDKTLYAGLSTPYFAVESGFDEE